MAAQPLVRQLARMSAARRSETAMSGRQCGALRGVAPARRLHCPRGPTAAAVVSMSMAAARPRAPVPGHRMAGGRACGAAAGRLPDRPASPSRARAVARRRPASGWDRVLPYAVAARLRVPLHRAGPPPMRGRQVRPDPVEGPASMWRRSGRRSGRPAARMQAAACRRLQAMASLPAQGEPVWCCLVMLRSAGVGGERADLTVPAPVRPGRGGAPVPRLSVRARGPAVPLTAG